MRIVLDATPLLGRRTGVGQYAAHLLEALAARVSQDDLDVQLAATTWTARGGRLAALPDGVEQVGPRVPARLLRAAWERTSWPTAELLVGATDVIHGTNFVTPPTKRAREVVMVHDLTYELHAATVSPDSLAYRTLVPRSLARGAHVVTPSRAVASAVREFYDLPPDRVTATPLGIDAPWYDQEPADAALRSRLALPAEYLLFVGSLDPRKNLGALLDAHARLRTAPGADVPPLVLAGPAGRDTTPDDVPGVLRTGWLDDADLRAVVAGATALVLPSLDEGFGLPALEALACGRRVVVSDVPALREITGDLAVRFDLADPRGLDDALLQVLAAPDDPSAREARRAHARRWTWDACARATLSAYGVPAP